MFFSPHTYSYKKTANRIWILAGLVFSILTAQAQYDDTSILEQPPPAQEYYSEQGDENRYFRQKSQGFPQDPVDARMLSDSALNEFKGDKAFWYADSVFSNEAFAPGPNNSQQQQRRRYRQQPSQQQSAPPPKIETKEYNPIAQQSWFQTLLWVIVIGGFIFFMLLYINSFRSKSKKLKEAASFEEDEEIQDIFAINYQRDIDKAAGNGNYRLAIRLMFLRLLKNLAEKNIIQYKQDRTNMDYLMQLSSTKYYPDFFRITRNYEYAWYGKLEVKEGAYKIIKKDFENFDPKTEVNPV